MVTWLWPTQLFAKLRHQPGNLGNQKATRATRLSFSFFFYPFLTFPRHFQRGASLTGLKIVKGNVIRTLLSRRCRHFCLSHTSKASVREGRAWGGQAGESGTARCGLWHKRPPCLNRKKQISLFRAVEATEEHHALTSGPSPSVRAEVWLW